MIRVNGERVPNRMLREELELLKSHYSASGEKLPDEARLKDDARKNMRGISALSPIHNLLLRTLC